jgi:hypothetical protein
MLHRTIVAIDCARFEEVRRTPIWLVSAKAGVAISPLSFTENEERRDGSSLENRRPPATSQGRPSASSKISPKDGLLLIVQIARLMPMPQLRHVGPFPAK